MLFYCFSLCRKQVTKYTHFSITFVNYTCSFLWELKITKLEFQQFSLTLKPFLSVGELILIHICVGF